MTAPARFDRLARIYRALEFAAFGRDLERARFCFLDRLASARSILILGEGDGRCVARLARLAPAAQIQCVDASAAMLAAAARRLPPDARPRVTLTHADALALELAPGSFDAVVTLFFLDCFTTEQAAQIVGTVLPALQPGARWLFADFLRRASGWPRWRAQLWLALLYTFFRWQTGLGTRELPESEHLLEAAGFAPEATQDLQHGLLRTTLYRHGP